jgi:4-hydroxy-4-methyl-2-oxoglutarate aldolase
MMIDAKFFERSSTAKISDAMDRLGICRQIHGVRHIAGSKHLVGRAFTVRYNPIGPSGGTVGDFIDDIPVGCLMVLANGSVSPKVFPAVLISRSRRTGSGRRR